MSASVSVIVPVFNAAGTLERCLSSLLNQEEPLAQIILIDDGSTDGSLAICRQFAKMHGTVEVHRQPNAGVSSARNRGLAVADGEYIGFVDPDDFVAPEMYARLLDASVSTGAPVCALGRYTVLPTAPVGAGPPTLVTSRAATATLLSLRHPSSVWAHLYSRNALSDVRFDEEVGLFEDLLFNFEVLRRVDTVAVLDGAYYHYSPGPTGANLGPFSETYLSALAVCARLRRFLRRETALLQQLSVLETHCLELNTYKIALSTDVPRRTYPCVRSFARSLVHVALRPSPLHLRGRLLILSSAVSPRLVCATAGSAIKVKRRLAGRPGVLP